MSEFIYKDLSYQINGIAFSVFKELGPGLREKIYADAFEAGLEKAELSFQREVHYPVTYKNKKITSLYFDFIIENKIVAELKAGERDFFQAFDQLNSYLKFSKLKLGLIIRFTKSGAKVKRIVNIKD